MNNYDSDYNNVTPVIKDGELFDGKQTNKKSVYDDEPPKPSKFGNVILTLLAIGLIIYGVNIVLNKNNDKEPESVVQDSSSNEESNSNKVTKKSLTTLESYVILSDSLYYNVFTDEDTVQLLTGLTNFSSNYIQAISSLKCDTFDKNGTIDGQEMSKRVKEIFGDIKYDKGLFHIGTKSYTYNQETDKYYQNQVVPSSNRRYYKYNYVESQEVGNEVYINEYVSYADQNSAITLLDIKLPNKIDGTNIKANYKNLKHYEYVFTKNDDDNYNLTKITIK